MQDYKTLTDADLTALLKLSDESAFKEIYDRYYFLLFTHAFKKLRDEETVKDIIQDVFAKLWSKRHELSGTNTGGYLYTAIRNKIFDLYAHEKVKTIHVSSIQNYLNVTTAIGTDHMIREKQFAAYIDREISALPPKMKQIFELSRMEYLSHKEIAERLETSENNVSKQVNNALKILKMKLGVIITLLVMTNM